MYPLPKFLFLVTSCKLTVQHVLYSVTQLCLMFCDPMDGSLSGSSVHGISQTRIVEWVGISFCRESSQLKDQTHVSDISCISRQILYP